MKTRTEKLFDEKLQALKEIQDNVKQDSFYDEILQMQRDGLIPAPTFDLEYGHIWFYSLQLMA